MIDFIIALGAFSIGLVVAIIILSIWYFTAVLLFTKTGKFIEKHGMFKILASIAIVGIPSYYVYQLILIQLTNI